jgi:threonine/homoserine/homoserine lactone efflux protein
LDFAILRQELVFQGDERLKIIRQTISKLVGLIQVVIGVWTIVFGFILTYNIFNFQILLNFPKENSELYLLISIIFGLLFIFNGIFLLFQNLMKQSSN